MRSTVFKILYTFGLASILRTARVKNQEIAVLMFHRISNKRDLLWPPLPTETFKRLVRELKRYAHVASFDEISSFEKYPSKPLVAISFDDGYRDFYENAMPVIDEYKLPVNHNACPGLIDTGLLPWTQLINLYLTTNEGNELILPGGRKYCLSKGSVNEKLFLSICNELYGITDEERNAWIKTLIPFIPPEELSILMSWEELRECSNAGVNIGSHSLTHRNLKRIINEQILKGEVYESKRRITEEIGKEPIVFAFPNGLYSDQSIQVVKQAGYKVALLCDDLVVTTEEITRQPFLKILPRINVSQPAFTEESLRIFGFHQRAKWLLKRTTHTFTWNNTKNSLAS